MIVLTIGFSIDGHVEPSRREHRLYVNLIVKCILW